MKIIAIDAIDIKSLGGLVHLQHLVKVLLKKNTHVKIFSNSFVQKNLNIDNSKKMEIFRVNIFDKNFIYRHLWKIFFFKKKLDSFNCEVLVSLNGIYHGFFKPTILLQQNVLPFDSYAKKKYRFISKVKFFFQKIAILISIYIHKNVVFTSKDLRIKILNNFKKKNFYKTKVIYHCTKKSKKVKNNFLLQNNIRLLFISEFQKYKNHEKLFEAIRDNKFKNINLTCIGRYDTKYIRKLNKKYNLNKLKIKVIKNIPQNEIFKIYSKFDALIFPTLCESFGLPLLEAASCKVPILCSDLKVFKEIYGDGCFYFNPKSAKSILNKIHYFSCLKKSEIYKKIRHNHLKANELNLNFFGKNYYDIILKTINFYEKKN